MEIDKCLQSLKDKEFSIKKKVEEIEKLKQLIEKTQSKIEDLEYSNITIYNIGIWNENLTKKVTESRVCVYDTEEVIVEKKGDYEYLTDISADILVKALRDSKQKYLSEIKDIEYKIRCDIKWDIKE